MYGAEHQYNSLRYNDIPDLMMGMPLTREHNISGYNNKSVSQTTGSANIVQQKKLLLH